LFFIWETFYNRDMLPSKQNKNNNVNG